MRSFSKEHKKMDSRTNCLAFTSLIVHEFHRYIYVSSLKIHPGLECMVWDFQYALFETQSAPINLSISRGQQKLFFIVCKPNILFIFELNGKWL